MWATPLHLPRKEKDRRQTEQKRVHAKDRERIMKSAGWRDVKEEEDGRAKEERKEATAKTQPRRKEEPQSSELVSKRYSSAVNWICSSSALAFLPFLIQNAYWPAEELALREIKHRNVLGEEFWCICAISCGVLWTLLASYKHLSIRKDVIQVWLASWFLISIC